MGILDLHFAALKDIRSLPAFHGARWSAVLRLAARSAGVDLETAVRGLYPLRQGTRPIFRGELLGLRLLVPAHMPEAWSPLIFALHRGIAGKGEFIPGQTLSLESVACGLSGRRLDISGPYAVSPLHIVHLSPLAADLSRRRVWRMEFETPLRLPRPEGEKRKGHRYCDADFFTTCPTALGHLVTHIRCCPLCLQPDSVLPQITSIELKWQDMRYSEHRQIALGGVTGALMLEGAFSKDLALCLAWGTITGTGKNPRFGLGYYRLMEIHDKAT